MKCQNTGHNSLYTPHLTQQIVEDALMRLPLFTNRIQYLTDNISKIVPACLLLLSRNREEKC
jgi:hypothetical protein